MNEDGETVIDEEEFELITQLKNLKQTYRYDYCERAGKINHTLKLRPGIIIKNFCFLVS